MINPYFTLLSSRRSKHHICLRHSSQKALESEDQDLVTTTQQTQKWPLKATAADSVLKHPTAVRRPNPSSQIPAYHSPSPRSWRLLNSKNKWTWTKTKTVGCQTQKRKNATTAQKTSASSCVAITAGYVTLSFARTAQWKLTYPSCTPVSSEEARLLKEVKNLSSDFAIHANIKVNSWNKTCTPNTTKPE